MFVRTVILLFNRVFFRGIFKAIFSWFLTEYQGNFSIIFKGIFGWPYIWVIKMDEKEKIELHVPSSQTSVSILTANALLCRCSVLWPFVGCLKQLFCGCCCSIGFSIVDAKNGTSRTCESPMRPGVVSTASSRSIISDDDSDSDDFFKCWPEKNIENPPQNN